MAIKDSIVLEGESKDYYYSVYYPYNDYNPLECAAKILINRNGAKYIGDVITARKITSILEGKINSNVNFLDASGEIIVLAIRDSILRKSIDTIIDRGDFNRFFVKRD